MLLRSDSSSRGNGIIPGDGGEWESDSREGIRSGTVGFVNSVWGGIGTGTIPVGLRGNWE